MPKVKQTALIKIKEKIRKYLKKRYGKGYTIYHSIYKSKRNGCYYFDLTYYSKSIIHLEIRYCNGRIERL